MDSVNCFIRRIAIPSVLVAYAGFLVWDYTVQDDGGRQRMVERHIANLRDAGRVDGLIVGGSNAVFSLSADLLQRWSGTGWYNAALLNEGYSDANYWAFMRDLAAGLDRAAVRTVVYSSLYAYRRGETAQREAYRGPISGHTKFSLKPVRSVLSYVKDYLEDGAITPTKPYPPPNRSGDFVFTEFECAGLPMLQTGYERERLDVAVEEIYRNVLFYAGLFPNARIDVAFPSEYHDDGSVEELARFNDDLLAALRARFAAGHEVAPGRVAFLFQPPFPTPELLCDGPHHGNVAGRRYRTADLFSQLAREGDVVPRRQAGTATAGAPVR